MYFKKGWIVFGLIIAFIANGFSQPVNEYGPLQVIGTHLCDSSGNSISLRGMSLGWHNWWPRFYNGDAVEWMADDWKIDVVRAAIGVDETGGYQSDSANAVDLAKNVIEGAVDAGIYVIIDWHTHNINKEDAITFFSFMARKYGHLPNIIYEIFNEPDTETWAEVKAYSEELIDTIRSIDSNNIILVGSPSWNQDLDLVAADPIKGFDNIMYTMHFYAATHGEYIRTRCDAAIEDSIPIFVSESAGCESDGDGDIDTVEWAAYIQWMEESQISWLCWTISDKEETCAALNTSADSAGNWTSDDLTETGKIYRTLFNKYANSYEPARIYRAMAKGRRGEDLVIGVIGGSITQGYAASTISNRWANLMTDWWEEKFPSSNVTLVNAGWGGTGSDIGVHRAYDDLFVEEPDFIVIEFSVNDSEGELAAKMMEGLVQQAILCESAPGIMILLLKTEDGHTAEASHKPIGKFYNIPMVNYADRIDAQLATDGLSLSDIYSDGTHPNDAGMVYIANFIKEKLDSIYGTLPESDDDLPEIDTVISATVIGDVFSRTFQFFPDNIIPMENDGWSTASTGWASGTPGDQVDFKLKGNAISLIYPQILSSGRGRAEVWVDDCDKTTIDCWMDEDWGTRYAYVLVDEDLDDSYHTLHIKTLSESSTSGNNVQIERLMVAGNIGGVMPIAKTSTYQKGVVGYTTSFDGSESYDPGDAEITSYLWSVSERPDGSTVVITNATDSIASFTPDVAGTYTISLVVSTLIGESVPATKTFYVKASNIKPVAVVGNDTMCATNTRFKLDGSNSYDEDEEDITYTWYLESKPEGSEGYVLVDDIPVTQVYVDIEGDYLLSLVVNDSIEDSEKSYITITAKEGYSKVADYKSLLNPEIYPNPTADKLTIEFYLDKIETVSLAVFSQSGQLILEKEIIETVQGKNQKILSMKEIVKHSGLYYLQLKCSSGINVLPFSFIND